MFRTCRLSDSPELKKDDSKKRKHKDHKKHKHKKSSKNSAKKDKEKSSTKLHKKNKKKHKGSESSDSEDVVVLPVPESAQKAPVRSMNDKFSELMSGAADKKSENGSALHKLSQKLKISTDPEELVLQITKSIKTNIQPTLEILSSESDSEG